jgi:hypothetical protein
MNQRNAPSHDQLSPKARGLAQQLNRTGACLIHHREDDSWTMRGQEVNHKAAHELWLLAALQTIVNLGYEVRYALSDEGRRLLVRPGYQSVIRKSFNRKPTT